MIFLSVRRPAARIAWLGSCVECIGQVGSGEYDDILSVCRPTRAERNQRRHERGGNRCTIC